MDSNTNNRTLFTNGLLTGLALGISAGALIMMFIYDTPERQAQRDVARCMEVAKIMMGKLGMRAEDTAVQANMAYRCLTGSPQ